MAEGEILGALCSEAEQEEIKKWCEENDCAISCMFENRLEKADEMREKGNAFLKDGDFEKAELHYYAAIFQLDFSMAQYGEDAKPYEDNINTRKLKVLSNLAVARLKHKKLVDTKQVADIGLRVCAIAKLDTATTQAAEAKFWYLTGQANFERGFSEDAVVALKKARTLAPEDKKVHQSLAQALAAKKEDHESAKEVWHQKLMTEDQKLSQGAWWKPGTLLAKLREQRRLRGCCGRRKDEKSEAESQDASLSSNPCATSSAAYGRHSYGRYSSAYRSRRPRY
jgi:tetratricopeptide (TPR) repeat protein